MAVDEVPWLAEPRPRVDGNEEESSASRLMATVVS